MTFEIGLLMMQIYFNMKFTVSLILSDWLKMDLKKIWDFLFHLNCGNFCGACIKIHGRSDIWLEINMNFLGTQ